MCAKICFEIIQFLGWIFYAVLLKNHTQSQWENGRAKYIPAQRAHTHTHTKSYLLIKLYIGSYRHVGLQCHIYILFGYSHVTNIRIQVICTKQCVKENGRLQFQVVYITMKPKWDIHKTQYTPRISNINVYKHKHHLYRTEQREEQRWCVWMKYTKQK